MTVRPARSIAARLRATLESSSSAPLALGPVRSSALPSTKTRHKMPKTQLFQRAKILIVCTSNTRLGAGPMKWVRRDMCHSKIQEHVPISKDRDNAPAHASCLHYADHA